MDQYYWDDKLEYLTSTRDLYYNDDYLEFLVKSVWKIHESVHIVDYGCGYGYLGLKLLPLLPQGSRYTGIDRGKQLIEKAKEIFQKLPYETEFIIADINAMYPDKKYDIAICHAFLLHMKEPINVLKKMINSVTSGGRIICFEPNWIASMSSYNIDQRDQSSYVPLGFLQRLFERDTRRDGKDGNIGIKLPIYLSKLGVKDVQCRVSDKVNFLDQNLNDERKQKLYKSIKMDGFGEVPNEKENFIQNLMMRGATLSEAQNQYESQLYLSKIFSIHSSLSYAPNMKITFGTIED